MKKMVIVATILTLIGIIADSSEVATREPSTAIMVCDDNIGDPRPKG